jgi:hypothetical protein
MWFNPYVYSVYTPDNYYSFVTLLLHFNNNATDNSQYNALMTLVGSPVYSSSVYKFGNYSANVSPSGKRFDTPTSASIYRLSTNDFTIEFWFNGSSTGTQRLMGNMAPGYSWSTNTTWVIGCYSGAIGFETPTSGVISGAARPFNGAWHHFAVVRQGTTITTYVDGVQDAQRTGMGFNIDQNATISQLSVGGSGNGTFATETFNGYMDDVRVTIGYARYTSTPFTVPSAAFPNSGPTFTFTFTNMAATGSAGPTTTTYNPTPPGWGGLSSGTQLWTIPIIGTYRITAAGAGGGFAQLSATTNPYPSSNGIIVSNTYSFTQGQSIKILVGQRGTDEQLNGGGTQYASGGGGTFVVYSSNNTPILVAGGGGGWWSNLASTSPGAGNGVATTSGTNGQAGGTGGTGGNAGSCGNNPTDAGAGFSSNLYNGNSKPAYAYSFLNGGLGQPGTIVIAGGTQIPGGFGCGGFGGGGYSGGGGLTSNGQRFGGGGGSYDINTVGNATIYTGLSGYSSGYNIPSSNGFVVIEKLTDPVPLINMPLLTNITNTGSGSQTATNVGAMTFGTVSGKQCISGTGVNTKYISISYGSTVPTTFTMCYWVYITQIGAGTGSGIGDTAFTVANSSFNADYNNTNVNSLTAVNSQWSNQVVTGVGTIPLNTWVHYAATLSTPANTLIIYINGIQSTSITGTAGSSWSGSTVNTIYIGCNGDGSGGLPGSGLYGSIRQFRFYTSVLNQAQISTIYNYTA